MVIVGSFSKSSLAFSEKALATVRIVPSFGFMTARYAVSTAFWKALHMISVFTSSWSRTTLQKPLSICDRITPELPLAPRREPDDIAFATALMGASSSRLLISLTADMAVIVIFVPVSPSGTGNTFSSLIQSFLASRLLAPARNILEQSCAFIVFVLTMSSLRISQ